MIFHLDNLAGVMNGNLRILFLMLLHQCLADGFFISYQYYLAAIFVDSLKYTLDNFLRAIVSTHYINCDFHLLGSSFPEWQQSEI